jgi:adenosine deaminase
MDQYEASLPYKNMIVGLGLDSDELDRPPSLFYNVFRRAKADGFRLTSHCDFNQKNTHEHIRQVAKNLGGSGAERIDHGMNAADDPDLMEMIKSKDIGLTICPCAYIRHASEDAVFSRIRKLFDAGIKITIASDDPAHMEDNWVLHNLHMVRDKCQFTNSEVAQLQRNAVSICWAGKDLKKELLDGIHEFEKSYSTQES